MLLTMQISPLAPAFPWLLAGIFASAFLASLILYFLKREQCAKTLFLLDVERSANTEKNAFWQSSLAGLKEEFRLLSRDALSSNSESFLSLAKSELEEKRKSVAETLLPVNEKLAKFSEALHEIDKSRVGAYSELRQQVEALSASQNNLRTETANLVKALRAPQTRGRWGEITLRRTVELAGMQQHCDFFEQVNTEGENGRLRPDLVVQLPGGKKIVVDSKVAFDAYLNALEAVDENSRAALLKNHARQIRTHAESLAAKSYWSQFDESPEIVIMFVPLETAFSAAIETDPSLLEWAVERRVIPASPMTLIALLQAVHYGWKQENISANARSIQVLGRELHDRIFVLSEHFSSLGKHLENATRSFNSTVGSLENRVLTKARELKEHGAGSAEKDAASPKEIETSPRIPRIQQSA